MKNGLVSSVGIFLMLSSIVPVFSFELATTIEKKGNSVSVSSAGYARMSLFRIATNEKGTIKLNGRAVIHKGVANIVMWSQVNGKYYFSKLPSLQNFIATTPMDFSIPFSSPKDVITEVVLEIELPRGGRIEFDNLALSKD